MSKFATLQDLTQSFLNGSFKFDPNITVGGVNWTLFDQHAPKITESLVSGKCPMVVYVNEQTKNVLIGAWTANSRNGLLPAGFIEVEGGDLISETERLIVEMNGEKITIRPDQLVGDVVRCVFTSLTSPREIQGKIDTGATVSSLHADRYTVKGTNIEFECKPLTDHVITVPLKTQHAVKSPDGGTVYRPVIELDVKVNGKLIKGALFNLNDRSHMDQPVLIGQNVLQAGKFFVDPSRTESVKGVDWDELQLLAEIAPIINRNPNDPILNEFYAHMLESDITFKDLVQHIRREVIKTFEDTE
jgi:hypothetical protein